MININRIFKSLKKRPLAGDLATLWARRSARFEQKLWASTVSRVADNLARVGWLRRSTGECAQRNAPGEQVATASYWGVNEVRARVQCTLTRSLEIACGRVDFSPIFRARTWASTLWARWKTVCWKRRVFETQFFKLFQKLFDGSRKFPSPAKMFAARNFIQVAFIDSP